MSKKISEFVVDTSITDASLLTYVKNGQNYAIAKSDFVTGLGVTGTIVPDGSVTGVPVLDTAGTVNNIRTLEAGAGVSIAVSPENGITLKHNFTQDAVGHPIILNPTATAPEFASLLAGSGIALSSVDNHIVVSTSAVVTATSTVVVNEMSDFPAAVTGVITLADNTDYFITNDLTTSDRFVLGLNSQLRSVSKIVNTLTYTGTGAMFSGEDVNATFRHITLATTNAAASFYSITSSTGAGIGTMAMDHIAFSGATMGSVACDTFLLTDCEVSLTVDGISTTATSMGIFEVAESEWVQTAGTCIDLGTTVCDGAEARNLFVTYSGGVTFLDGMTASGNIAASSEGSVFDVRLKGAGTPLNNISPDDSLWYFAGNNTIRDTRTDALLSLQGNATNTVIGVAGTGVLAAGTWVAELESQMTVTAAGRVTHNGSKDFSAPITASVSVAPASGGTKTLGCMIAINGTVKANSLRTTSTSSGNPSSITLPWQEELSPSDYVEVFITNEDDTTDVLVSSALLRVN